MSKIYGIGQVGNKWVVVDSRERVLGEFDTELAADEVRKKLFELDEQVKTNKKDHEKDEIYQKVVDGLDPESYLILCKGYLESLTTIVIKGLESDNDYLLEVRDYSERLIDSYNAYLTCLNS